eukprot:Gregarina_sp_Poly_1__772@NODE_1184_length_4843_cov_219_562814_g814_i0_p1_GENE_NODE_1184_length_4843_cov_219_562814_g814_i0NODE_1184_length_4843_cov_219_562814_g814_i0_p1_ORF_typecomplete_len457_score92_40DUF2205/PF10224_9/0_0037DUF2353/PF09789_9/0_0057CEP209_CC5/PF16574_5/0_012DUF3584/PF12128_8/0_022Cast/PF10174_9/1_6Filament/PF00038_21/0_094AIP3/PF03915_13/0_03Phage_HK97_TLTM/PF06120_11/0_12ZapB/PF06005_12/0_097ZapB/PF06005_12/12FapA/PF03961_13/0_13DUF3552/PF12072_8/0_19bZIP_1/PF00170_21/0_12bZ
MEMLLMKLSAEQAHQKFREEIRLAERKAEERVAEVKSENQKLKSENQNLESKLADLEKKFLGLQKSIESTKLDSPRKKGDIYKLGSDRSTSREPNVDTIDELRRQNERLLQLLLRQSSQNHQPLWHPGCHNVSPNDFHQMMASLSPPQTRNGNADLSVDTRQPGCLADSYLASQLAQASSLINVPTAEYVSAHVPAFRMPHSVSAPAEYELPLLPYRVVKQRSSPHTVTRSPHTVTHSLFVGTQQRNCDPFNCDDRIQNSASSSWPLPPGEGNGLKACRETGPSLRETASSMRETGQSLRETASRRLPPVPTSNRQGRLPTRHNRNRSVDNRDSKGVLRAHSVSVPPVSVRPPSPPLEERRALHGVSSATGSKKSGLLENRRSAGAVFPRTDNVPVEDAVRGTPAISAGGRLAKASPTSNRLRSGSSSSSSSVSSSPLTSRSKQLLAELLKKGESS